MRRRRRGGRESNAIDASPLVTQASRWKKENGEKTSRAVVDSLRVSSTKTNLKKDEASDYRTYKSKMPDLTPQKNGGGAMYNNGD